MDITTLLNSDDDGADWVCETSDTEDEVAVSATNYDDEDVVFESNGEAVLAVDESAVAERLTCNPYVDNLIRESGLHIIRENEVKSAYKERGELGLFSLFFTREFCDSLHNWTNKMLKEKGKTETTVYKLDAYIGLAIAMSFNRVTEMKELWSQNLFTGQSDFAANMPRNRFESIRARFQVYAPGNVPVEQCEQDPLWNSRRLMRQIQEKFARIAVPVGAVSLDENTVRTKSRSAAKTYMPSKPEKYGVRFYAVVGSAGLYAYAVWDNGSGNRTRASPAERYVDVFPGLRSALFRTLERDEIPMGRKDASSLWVTMCGHLTKTFAALNCHRQLVCDNFYTKHNLAKTLMAFTDGEMRMLGTVRITLQGKSKTMKLNASNDRIYKSERGS